MLLRRLSQELGLSHLKEFASPAFFKVVSARALTKRARQLLSNYRDAERFAHVLDLQSHCARGAGVPLQIGPEPEPSAPIRDGAYGQHVLELYFAQLFRCDMTILDLQGESLGWDGHRLRWSPRPLYARWEPEFIEAIRELYAGYYAGDERAFRHALDALGLRAAEDTFRAHFGNGQDEVRFDLREMIETFSKVFSICASEGAHIPADFALLGAYLATLYENLERFDRPFDVRAAFDSIVAKTSTSSVNQFSQSA